MFANPLHETPRLPALYEQYSQKEDCQALIRNLKKKIQSTHDILQLEELKCRKRVLRRLGFTNSADIVDVKGRVACEISTGDELLLTELIFNGVFNPLLPEQCAALLSCFVFTEKVCISESCTLRLFISTWFSERANCTTEGGIGAAFTNYAGNRTSYRQSGQGKQATRRRRRIRLQLQGRAYGCSSPMVSRCILF